MKVLENITALKNSVGEEFGPTEWITITQKMVDDFASATQDFQWIHVDVERAKKESPFGGPIAHGFMTVSLVSRFLELGLQIKSVKMGVNYGLNKVRLTAAVPVGGKLRLKGTIKAVEDYPNNGAKMTIGAVIELEGSERPACIAEFVGLMFE